MITAKEQPTGELRWNLQDKYVTLEQRWKIEHMMDDGLLHIRQEWRQVWTVDGPAADAYAVPGEHPGHERGVARIPVKPFVQMKQMTKSENEVAEEIEIDVRDIDEYVSAVMLKIHRDAFLGQTPLYAGNEIRLRGRRLKVIGFENDSADVEHKGVWVEPVEGDWE